MTEEHPFNNRTMYGATKIAGEQFFRAFNEQHGLDYVGLRYMNVYGPRMDYEGTYVSVIMKVLDRIDAGEPPVIYGDGSRPTTSSTSETSRAANILALKADATDVVLQRRHGRQDDDQRARRPLLEITGSTSSPSTAAGADVRHQPRRQHREGRALLGFRAEIALARASRPWSSGGARTAQRL